METPIKIHDLGCKKPYFWKHLYGHPFMRRKCQRLVKVRFGGLFKKCTKNKLSNEKTLVDWAGQIIATSHDLTPKGS